MQVDAAGDSDEELMLDRICTSETEFTEFKSLLIAPIEQVPDEGFLSADIDLQIGDLFSSINNQTNLLKKSLAAKTAKIEVAEFDVDISRTEDDHQSELNLSVSTVVHQPEPFRISDES